jgi:hypothetical protein
MASRCCGIRDEIVPLTAGFGTARRGSERTGDGEPSEHAGSEPTRRQAEPKGAASEQPAALAARQREHRLRVHVRPQEPAGPHDDPWLICADALDAVDRLRTKRSVGYGFTSIEEDLELIEERCRQLAWGPSPEKSE